MTTELRDGLRDLAERTPTAVPPPDLWRRGVRRRRRVQAVAAGATAAAVAAGVLLTTVALDTVRTADPAPVDTPGSGAIPDRLRTPSPWLEGAEGEPPGALAVIAGAERRTGWRGTLVNGWVGVSAHTGEYRFLDLPGAVDLEDDWFEADPVLSPDGRAVAYWLAHPEDARWVGGWAVYDTVSGDVVRHRVGSRLGLAPETLAWTGPDQLLVEHGVVTEREGSSFGWDGRPTLLWSAEGGAPRPIPENRPLMADSVSPTRRAFATLADRRLVLREPRQGQRDISLRLRAVGDLQAGTVNADGTNVVLLPHASDLSVRRLLVGEVPPDATDGDSVATEALQIELDMYHLVGWQDPDHVLVRARLQGRERRFAGVYAVDVRTGSHELLVRETRENWIGAPDYAGALWERPTVARPAPDRAYDPRLIAGAGGLVAGGLVLLVLRRRRARG